MSDRLLPWVAENDAARLGYWLLFAADARDELQDRLGVDLSGTREDLVPLWTAVLARVRRNAGPPLPPDALPRWAGFGFGEKFSPETVELIGLTAAYMGDVMIDQLGSPDAEWQVLRKGPADSLDIGWIVLGRGGPSRTGAPERMANLLNTVSGLVGQYLADDARVPYMPKDFRSPERLLSVYDRTAAGLASVGAAAAGGSNAGGSNAGGSNAGGASTWLPDRVGRRIPVTVFAEQGEPAWSDDWREVTVTIPEWAATVLGADVYDRIEGMLAGLAGVESADHHDREQVTLRVTRAGRLNLRGLRRRVQAAFDTITPPADKQEWATVPDVVV